MRFCDLVGVVDTLSHEFLKLYRVCDSVGGLTPGLLLLPTLQLIDESSSFVFLGVQGKLSEVFDELLL